MNAFVWYIERAAWEAQRNLRNIQRLSVRKKRPRNRRFAGQTGNGVVFVIQYGGFNEKFISDFILFHYDAIMRRRNR